jgi:hypothetical protein
MEAGYCGRSGSTITGTKGSWPLEYGQPLLLGSVSQP